MYANCPLFSSFPFSTLHFSLYAMLLPTRAHARRCAALHVFRSSTLFSPPRIFRSGEVVLTRARPSESIYES